MTPADLDTLQALSDAATGKEWRFDGRDVFTVSDGGNGYLIDRYPDSIDIIVGQCPHCGNRRVGVVTGDNDMDFIAAARMAVPALIADMRELKAALAAADKQHAALMESCERIQNEAKAKLAEMTKARDAIANIADLALGNSTYDDATELRLHGLIADACAVGKESA